MAGKTGKGKATRAKPKSGQEKAGVVFAPARITRYLKQGRYADNVSGSAGVFLAAVFDYLCSEILEIAGTICEQQKFERIKPRHLQLAIRNDDELAKLMANIMISDGGYMPNIQEFLFPKKDKKAAGETQEM